MHLKTLLIALVAALGLTVLAPLSANAAPDCQNLPATKWKFTNVSKSYKPTKLYSNWVHPKHGSMTVTFSQQATSQWTGTVSASLTAEAGVVFAKASTTIGASIAKTWSKSKTWSYSVTVKKDTKHEYRLRQRQETRKFTATKYSLYRGDCSYKKVKSGTGEMPRKLESSLVWDTQRRAA